MKEISYKTLRSLAVLYLGIPILIFFWGWLNPAAAAVFTLLLAAGVFFLFRSTKDGDFNKPSIKITVKKLAVILIISFLWCLLAGQGGFFHQSTDHEIRNMIIEDLIRSPWPVVYPESGSMLCYYIAHWMVPTLFGKAAFLIFGSAPVGYAVCNAVLLVWSTLGCFLTLMLFSLITCRQDKTRIILSVILFILFSGADIILVLPGQFDHLEWSAIDFQYSSNTTCLFWVYNQAIAAWIATLCILNENRVKNFAILALLAFPYAPLPFIGLFLICIVKGIVLLIKGRKTTGFLRFLGQVFSPQNILAVLSIMIVFLLYFSSNQIVNGDATGLRINDGFVRALHSSNFFSTLFVENYFWFVITEFVFLAAALLPYKKKDPLFYVVVISLFIIPLIQVGISKDFCMRVSIPCIIYLCVSAVSVIQNDLPEREFFRDKWCKMKKHKLLTAAGTILLLALIVFLYTPYAARFVSPGMRLLLPELFMIIVYVPPYLKRKYPNAKLFSTKRKPGLKAAYTAIVILLLLGAFTPYAEFKREITATITEGQNFSYDKDETLADKPGYYNFLAKGYEDSAFYKYICKK